MKNIIFILLLAQTISFLYGDDGCYKYSYRWGRKAPNHEQCDCPCSKYQRAHNKCMNCRHINVPVALPNKTTEK